MTNGLQSFVNMKRFILLILLLGLIKVVLCVHIANVTEDQETCPISLLRRKRANMEYTRWRSNMESTPEFIVKVLDDLPMSTPIVAVNIFSGNKRDREEKIIVGGAMVPPHPSLNTEVLRDYTRFQPPTNEARETTEEVLVTIKDPISPKPDVPIVKEDVVYPGLSIPERNLNRDESPPAGPQFLRRNEAPPSPQLYAPIAPVAFTLHALIPSLSPSPINDDLVPKRTSYKDGPSRSSDIIDDLSIIRNYYMTSEDSILTRTSTAKYPMRTTIKMTSEFMFVEDNDDFLNLPKTKKPIKYYEDEDFPKSIEIDLKQNSVSEGESYRDNNGEEYKDSRRKNMDGDFEHEQPNPEDIRNMIKYIFTDKPNNTDDPQTPEDDFDNESDASIPLKELKGVLPKGPDDIQSRERRRPLCSMVKLRQINFNTPRTLPEIVATLKQWTEESPLVKMADVTDGNLTTMENPIHIMIIDDPSVGQIASEKQTVLLIAGIQGRDHFAVASAMFVLYQLIERSESHYDLLSKYRFWIIPVFNPDGYDYSMTFPNKREWSKNLRQTWDICPGREACRQCDAQGLRCAVSPCYGVNLDRNFEYQWMPPEELRAEHPCGKLYAGPRQLSEPETQALTNFLHRQHMNIAVFIAFKEGTVLGVMYPYSHTKKKRTFDHLYRNRATRAAAATYGIAGRSYVAGQTSEFLPLYAGGIEDWADGHLGIDNTYTIMMHPPGLTGSKNVEHLIHEAFTAMDSLLLQSLTSTDEKSPIHTLTEFSKAPRRHSDTKAILFLVFTSTLFSQYLIHTNIS